MLRFRPGPVALFVFLLAPSAFAISVVIDPSVATVGAIAPSALINQDLAPKTWTVHPTVGYFAGSTTVDAFGATASSSGWGGTAEAQYSWTEHIGVNFSGLDYSGSGSYTPVSGEPGSSGSSSVSGWLIGAALVLDPFSGPGFRLPIFFGLNYQHLSSSMPSSSTITALMLSSAGYTFGFSPRFNVAFLRLEPFLVATTPFSQGDVTCGPTVVSGACGALNIPILPVYGVDIVFRPWNLSFFFNAATFLLGTGVSYYSLGAQFTF